MEDNNRGRPSKIHDGTDTNLTRTQVASAAGLSERQKVTALRVAMVPAVRIQARAIRRCGELLRQVEAGQGTRTDRLHDAADMKLTRTQVAAAAGLSERHVSQCCPCAPSKAVKIHDYSHNHECHELYLASIFRHHLIP